MGTGRVGRFLDRTVITFYTLIVSEWTSSTYSQRIVMGYSVVPKSSGTMF